MMTENYVNLIVNPSSSSVHLHEKLQAQHRKINIYCNRLHCVITLPTTSSFSWQKYTIQKYTE